MMYGVPFNRPTIVGKELYYISQAILNGHSSGDGGFTRQCHQLLESSLGVPKALLTTSCTHALEMSAILLDIQPGDEVIVPSFTFVSTVNAYVLRGARPVFIDVRQDTLNLDETRLEGLITPRTKAVLPVHYAGVGCEMDSILEVARRYGIAVVEDNAHGLFGKYQGKYLGTFGDLATQSFHETKNFTCGEGGALLINNPAYVERAEIIREKGTNRSRFFRGMVDKYTWVDIGSSYLPSELVSAFLYAQLEHADEIIAKRRSLCTAYATQLDGLQKAGHLRLPAFDKDSNGHMFYILLDSLDTRSKLIAHLKSQGILPVFHYVPLHSSPAGKKYGRAGSSIQQTDDLSERLLRLPLFYEMKDEEIVRVCAAINAFFANS